ncbi:universal stress protein [Streptomyces sp. UG1]|uniref:universal stress protein n=1 Tax=Streptomyces sp. UG1 TaxID=3417652 RepID=UPI003CF582F8
MKASILARAKAVGSMTLPLVVGVDGSEAGLWAADWATDEAALHGLPLRIVHASLWERYEGPVFTQSAEVPAEHALAQDIVDRAAERARKRNPDVKITVDILPDDAEAALLREARLAAAVVTGCRGRGPITCALLASVSRSLATHATSPVVVVRGSPPNRQGANGRIVVGVGDASTSTVAIAFAFREAEARRCALDAVRAWRRPAHKPLAHPLLAGDPAHHYEDQASALLDDALRAPELEHPDVVVHRIAAEGPAHHVLLTHSATADLLVLGAPRRHGPLALPLGRVMHAALQHAQCPVAVVPQRAAASAAQATADGAHATETDHKIHQGKTGKAAEKARDLGQRLSDAQQQSDGAATLRSCSCRADSPPPAEPAPCGARTVACTE